LISPAVSFLFSVLRPPPSPTLFPYTTLFRSVRIHDLGAGFTEHHDREKHRGLAARHDHHILAIHLYAAVLENVLGYRFAQFRQRSEEHTSELQSRENLVCRLLLDKKKILTMT